MEHVGNVWDQQKLEEAAKTNPPRPRHQCMVLCQGAPESKCASSLTSHPVLCRSSVKGIPLPSFSHTPLPRAAGIPGQLAIPLLPPSPPRMGQRGTGLLSEAGEARALLAVRTIIPVPQRAHALPPNTASHLLLPLKPASSSPPIPAATAAHLRCPHLSLCLLGIPPLTSPGPPLSGSIKGSTPAAVSPVFPPPLPSGHHPKPCSLYSKTLGQRSFLASASPTAHPLGAPSPAPPGSALLLLPLA